MEHVFIYINASLVTVMKALNEMNLSKFSSFPLHSALVILGTGPNHYDVQMSVNKHNIRRTFRI